MFRILVPQKFHGLSDDATEERIFVRTSFKAFLGLRIGGLIPEAKTIRDFKQRIEADGREGSRKLFEAFNAHLESRGVIAREGSIIDASFTEAPRQHIKQGERPEDFDTNPAEGKFPLNDTRKKAGVTPFFDPPRRLKKCTPLSRGVLVCL